MLIFITGGVRSGKSRFAEGLARSYYDDLHERCGGARLIYLATSHISDDEMRERIERHQLDRHGSGYPWVTWEQPVQMMTLVPALERDDVLLIDCLTTWLSNELFQPAFSMVGENGELRSVDFLLEQMRLHILQPLQKMATQSACLLVSNEIAHEPLFLYDPWTQCYIEILQRLHQEIVAMADQAYLIEYGLPQRTKW